MILLVQNNFISLCTLNILILSYSQIKQISFYRESYISIFMTMVYSAKYYFYYFICLYSFRVLYLFE